MQPTLEITPDTEHLGSLSIKGVLPMVSNISTTVSFVTMLISMYTGIDGLSLEYFDRSISLRSIFFTSSTVDLLMTEYAERHQIILIMRASVREWTNVMDKRREDVSALLLAGLAEWMPCQVSVTNPAPRAAVPLVLIVATSEMVIMPLHCFLVRLAVAALSIRKVRAARHAAGSLRLSRHRAPPRGIKKALAENCFSEKADSISYSC